MKKETFDNQLIIKRLKKQNTFVELRGFEPLSGESTREPSTCLD
jgi:hypothetical protein